MPPLGCGISLALKSDVRGRLTRHDTVRTAYWHSKPRRGKGGSAISVQERKLLLLRAQAGDSEALNVLFESCRKRLYCKALRILASPQDAEDVVQEAMLAAFRHLHRFEGRADFLTWATRIVINAALQHIRKARTKPTVSWDHVQNDFETGFSSDYSKDRQPTPEEHLQGLECREMLEDALAKLPPESRQAIELCKFGDRSLKEAASTLGLTVSTVKVRLHRGRRAMMAHLKRKMQVRRKYSVKNRGRQFCTAPKQSLVRSVNRQRTS
jgi:RNA polymerase sigma-70 factor, ECF subfamily